MTDSFSVISARYNARGIAFNLMGLKCLLLVNGDKCNEYTLSTGFDISTASYSISFSYLLKNDPWGIAFNADG
jgi:hypothetical protein